MKSLRLALLASAAGLTLAGVAQAADLPSKVQPAPPPSATDCYASFSNWFLASPADCPLSYMGVTLYGAIDVGGGYESNAARFNGDFPNGISEQINKFNTLGGRWLWVPNGLTQSNIGIKIKEQLAPTWFLIGDANFGFDPYSFQFANGPKSLVDNNYTPTALQTANGDSSRDGGLINSRAYLGFSNTTYGTLTVGRQYTFTNDMATTYDPMGGAYGFSLIGTSGTVVAGTGDTELARYNTSVRYQVGYNGLRAGVVWQFGDYSEGNGSKAAVQANVGADFGGLSVDAVYAYAKDAVSLGAYGGTPPFPDYLKATLQDVNAAVIAAKYKWNAVTFYGGYEYAQLSNPSDPIAAGSLIDVLGGYTGVVQANAYNVDKDLQVGWLGAKYAVLSDLDVAVAWYHEWQNDYTGTPGACVTSTANSKCAGTTDDLSALLDYRPLKRVDLYTGVLYSKVAGGMANGFPNNNTTTSNVAWTSGVKFGF